MEFDLSQLLVTLVYEKLVFALGKNFRLSTAPMFNSTTGPVWFVNDRFYSQQRGHAVVDVETITVRNYDVYRQNAWQLSNWVHLLYYLETNPGPVLDAWTRTNYSAGLEINVWPPVQLVMISENNTYSISASYPDLSKYCEISGEWK